MPTEEEWLEYEKMVKSSFPYKEYSAEEFAAREGHCIGCFSLDSTDTYVDQEFDAWIKTLGPILRSCEEMDRVRKQHLTPDEIQRIESLPLDL